MCDHFEQLFMKINISHAKCQVNCFQNLKKNKISSHLKTIGKEPNYLIGSNVNISLRKEFNAVSFP